ncbi:hypothetical protein GCM10025857_21130 [Alicyclobacillus contaminans]|nr:hypothetical protein GCM10025857_21130 [Alicyclobacillus contaminans]
MHRAVQHAMQSSLTLSVIPAGTGNDFVKTIGIPTDPVQALHEMMAGCERVVDILRVNDRWTVNAMGIGLDADVVEAVERHRTVKRMGRLAYAAVLPGVLFRHRRFSLHMLIDGEQVCADDVSLVVVSNGPAFGGGMRLAPQACVDDGLLDVCVVAGITKPRLLMLFPSVYRGRHVHLPYVRFFRGQSIQMSLPEGCKSAQLDGEWLPSVVNLAVSVQANALRLLTPSHR